MPDTAEHLCNRAESRNCGTYLALILNKYLVAWKSPRCWRRRVAETANLNTCR